MSKWIFIGERLPEKSDADEDGYVMAIIKDLKKVIILWEDVGRFTEYITYWTHIPKYPKENE